MLPRTNCAEGKIDNFWSKMAKHHPDLVMCRKQPGISIGRLCEKCECISTAMCYRILGLLPLPCSVIVFFFFSIIFTGDGRCVICDSFVNPQTQVRICDECNYGSFEGRCVVCGGIGVADAFYCRECCQMERDRDGCPKIVNLGATKMDLFYERKKYNFKKR